MIKECFVYNEVSGEGAENTAAVLSFAESLSNSNLAPDTFTVIGRRITGITVSDAPAGVPRESGSFLTLQLEPESVLERVRGRSEHVNIHYRTLAIRQNRALVSTEGKEIPMEKDLLIATRNITPIADKFHVFIRNSLKYNLFIPKNYDPSQRYPLVVFIHDAGCNSHDPKTTLLQGRGAIAFADPELQEKTPCFVLAPVIPAGCRMTTDEFTVTEELEKIMDTIRALGQEYSINPDRITLTGQSMGCMASCELLTRYPDYFAGALLVAGQWSPERMAQTAPKKNLWIIVCAGDRGAFPGMNAVTEAMEQAGAEIKRYQWNGKTDISHLEAQAKSMIAESAPIKYSVFDADSVKTPANSGPGANHGGTWALVYRLKAVCSWLVEQSRI